MARGGDGVMPPASPNGRRSSVLPVLGVVVAAALGAAVVLVWRAGGHGPSSPGGAAVSVEASPSGAAVSACLGGADPARAVREAVTAPSGPEGAAGTAAAVVRWTESMAFGAATAEETIGMIGDPLGSPKLTALYEGQAPYLAQMTASAAHPGRGAWMVSPEPLTPTVTVLTPVRWSTQEAQHHDWRVIDVRLMRQGERWAVVSADTAVAVPAGLEPLRGTDVRDGDLDRLAAALTAGGFQRYTGDC
ncbi:hypothetical protein QTQ03_28355 [Micromonospora sp. WMMA1363]|uniref:hypothetical protein n=1 Tax=Micromonospora sp. WMMA1363 TaxID=3053985 RepID=UPI00259CD8B1|nr:hypothetical protein [Micromonospora sp. WMMA1363]MDM4723320.1 hypothetical protein [Micromonospora sp. WMMA1363]